MQSNVIVEMRKFFQRLLQARFAVDLNLAKRALESAKETFNPAIHPWGMWLAASMPDAQPMHGECKENRDKCAIVVGANRSGLSKALNQFIQRIQNRDCAPVRELESKQSPATVINYAQHIMSFLTNCDVRPIQSPSLIGFAWLWWCVKLLAQLQNFIATAFTHYRDIALTNRFTAKTKARIEHSGNRSTTHLAARHCQQSQHFHLHPAGLASGANRLIGYSYWYCFAARKVLPLVSFNRLTKPRAQQTDHERQQHPEKSQWNRQVHQNRLCKSWDRLLFKRQTNQLQRFSWRSGVLCLSLLFCVSEVFAADLSSSAFDQRAVANLSTSILNGVARPSAGAKGRLTTAVDGTATTKYQYDDHGRVISKSQVVGTETAKTQLMSFLPTGQLDQHTLPSGAIVKYSYRADGRVVSIQVNGVTIISELDYFPFGEVKSWKYNTSDRYARSFDTNGRVKEHTAGGATRAISFDPGSRITAIADGTGSANQWTFDYDKLDRLKTAENAATAGVTANSNLAWTFDATGNRLSEARGTPAVSTSYTIDSVSNKLSQVGAVNRGYDSVGNTITVGTDQSVYSSRNRLVRATKAGTTADYGYNAFGERVRKTIGGATSQFVYDVEGHVVGEYSQSGSSVSEYVWLGNVPVAVIKSQAFVVSHAGTAAGTNAVFMVQPDHLDTPRVIVNASNQPVWRWDSAPFGETLANEQPTTSLASFRFDLRFPGQQFDAESGSHYNYFRDYEAATGRYLQSDPIGLEAGANTFTYVASMPLYGVDPKGLIISIPKPPSGRGSVPLAKRDPQRLFPRKMIAERLIDNGCTCDACGAPLELPDADGHHLKRHADGGRTKKKNLAALCKPCHKKIHKP
jgi:RHS repeat-associated protein